jgi:hypothetical protein
MIARIEYNLESLILLLYHFSGEVAFKVMTEGFGWAKYPMINRITDVPAFIPMTIIYGSRSWVDSGVGWQVKYIRSDSFVDVQVSFLFFN